MVQRKQGHMVFMSSLGGIVPAAGFTVYNATKFSIGTTAKAQTVIRANILGTMRRVENVPVPSPARSR
jgi:NADP-dependent 3-hydroxy acid dehydrogenase YdfG